MTNHVLVIGGGMAGIRSSLDLLKSGFKVTLIEAEPQLGGKIAELDCILCKVCHRYFPNESEYEKMICGRCFVTDLIEDISRDKNIEIIRHSEIDNIERDGKDFIAHIKTSPKQEKECIESCDLVPEKTIRVGAIIMAPGFEEFNPSSLSAYGYGIYQNVVTSSEFERILITSGSTIGKLIRPSDGKQPEKIAFIQCVGSRDSQHGNPYCSSICCMFALKEAVMAQESTPGLSTSIFFIDMRAFSKEYENYLQKAKENNVHLKRGNRISQLIEDPETRNLKLHYIEGNELVEDEFDMVVLSVGMNPPQEAQRLAKMMGIKLNEYGFCANELLFSPSDTSCEGVYVAGVFSHPNDIQDTIAQASGAAAKVSSYLLPERGMDLEDKVYPPERDVSEQDPRIGIFLGYCNSNIDDFIEMPQLTKYSKSLPDVVCVESRMYSCFEDMENFILKKIKEHNLNRIVCAGSPQTHEFVLANTLKRAGINPNLFEIVNLREQCAWVHLREPDASVAKARDLVRMAAANVRLLEPIKKVKKPIHQSGLVIGGGVTGMVAAIELSKQGFNVYLVEKESELGGMMRRIHYEFGLGATDVSQDVQKRLQELRDEIESNRRVHIFTKTEIKSITGSIGNFTTTIEKNGSGREIKSGVIIIATGGEEYKPTEYLYGKDHRIMTQLELEGKLANEQRIDADTVVMIQCVGCRNEDRPYCSRVCCSESIKNALKIKDINPAINIYLLYRDIRTYGFTEKYYQKAAAYGVRFIRYEEEDPPLVTSDNGLYVKVKDKLLNEEVSIKCDILALGAATIPSPGNSDLCEMLGLRLNNVKFFLESHTKFSPVEFNCRGVYVAGLAHSPKFFEECISQAEAAVARASTILWKKEMELEPRKSEVIDANCDGCAYCVDPCPFNALKLIEYTKKGNVKKTIERDEATCRGCGICMATCPKQGIMVRGFTLSQLGAMVDSALEMI